MPFVCELIKSGFRSSLLMVMLLAIDTHALMGQVAVTREDNQLIEKYHILNRTDSVMDGVYQLFYKSHLIEQGNYTRGRKTGVWTYLNLGNTFEFQYDYDADSLIRIAGASRQMLLPYESPCMFLGSSLVPYAFLTSRVGYPAEAFKKGVQGKVELVLVIDTTGQIKHHYVVNNDRPLLSDAVLRAVDKFPTDWRWIPARSNKAHIESTYTITIHFDLH